MSPVQVWPTIGTMNSQWMGAGTVALLWDSWAFYNRSYLIETIFLSPRVGEILDTMILSIVTAAPCYQEKSISLGRPGWLWRYGSIPKIPKLAVANIRTLGGLFDPLVGK